MGKPVAAIPYWSVSGRRIQGRASGTLAKPDGVACENGRMKDDEVEHQVLLRSTWKRGSHLGHALGGGGPLR